jgi:hypothetical protein
VCRDCKQQHPELYAQLSEAFDQLMELKRRASRKSITLTNEAVDYAVQRYNSAMQTIRNVHESRREQL